MCNEEEVCMSHNSAGAHAAFRLAPGIYVCDMNYNRKNQRNMR